MDIKALATVAIIAAVVGGVVGGLVASSGNIPTETLKVKSIEADEITAKKVNSEEFISQIDDKNISRIKGGMIVASQSVVADNSVVGGTVRGNLMAAQGLQLVRNPIVGNMQEWDILGDIAIRKGGASIVLRNNDGVLKPGNQNATAKGNSTYIGYSDAGLPLMYVHDQARGNAGVSPIYVPKVINPEEKPTEVKKDEKPKASK